MPMILLRSRPQGAKMAFRPEALAIVVPALQPGTEQPGMIPVVVGSNIMTPAGALGVMERPDQIADMVNSIEGQTVPTLAS